MNIRIMSGLAVVPLIFSLAACGGSKSTDGVASAANGSQSATPSASASLSPADAQIKFAQCMRQNGVPMKDPAPGKPLTITGGAAGDMSKLQSVQKKCQHFLAEGGISPGSNNPGAQDAMLKFAQCMRKNGVNVPDPQPGGGVTIKAPGGSPAKFQAAQKACSQYLPGALQGGGAAGTPPTGGTL